jgi:hypothetical protein
MAGSWKPLLTGDLAERARAAVSAVAEALPNSPVSLPGEVTEPMAAAWKASIASGAAGEALLYSYLAFDREARGEESPAGSDPADIALDLLDRATETVADVPMSDSLYSGFAGIAWLYDHLDGRLFEGGGDANREVDEALISALEHLPWRGEYDLINGLVGLGIYALEGLPRPTAARCLERIVAALAGLAEQQPEGSTWFSPPERAPAYLHEQFPQGLYNLGASHGMAGIVGLLGAACGAGVATGVARPLLADAVRWLLAHRHGPESPFCFSHFFYPGIDAGPSRLAWCYGDLGMAATLLVAARGAAEPDWERTALEIARHAAERPDTLARVSDPGLCHGACGVAHLFNRMYQTTGDEPLARAAERWFERALAFQQPDVGVGGFRSWATGADGEQDWRDDPGFLEGGAGVALALLAATSSVGPEWDRLLLASARS